MSAATVTRRAALLALVVLGGASCGEDFATAPSRFPARLELRAWSDTLVLGEQRPVSVRAFDEAGHEVLGAKVRWAVGTDVVGYRPAVGDAAPTSTSEGLAGDELRLDARRTGATDVVVTLDDPRFTSTTLTARATVVVGGVRVATAHDTTLAALGDTALVVGTALARQGASFGAPLVARAGQGLTWRRLGPGALRLVGQGDSVRAIAAEPGTDTLVAAHAVCLRGGRCADTVVVHVAQAAAPLGVGGREFRLWSFGDTVAPSVVVRDARGNAIRGATVEALPLGDADSAFVRVERSPAPAAAIAAAVASGDVVIVARPTVLAARSLASLGISAVAAPAQPVVTAPIVARGNGTARVLVRARAADGTTLGADTISIVVRQVAAVVRVTPQTADMTPGDSIPVQFEARDARGFRIADAEFRPAMVGATLTASGWLRIPPTAAAGTATLAAIVDGTAAPEHHAGAPIAPPAPDTATIVVRMPTPAEAGNGTAGGIVLTAPVLGTDRLPRAGVWVRFLVPAGTVSPDSVQTDAAGIAAARWTLPTRAGAYTATAITLGGALGADSSGRIVLRRTESVRAAAPAGLRAVATAPATGTIGQPLAGAPAAQLVDAYGNAVRQAGVPVSVTLSGAVATLGGAQTVTTDDDGVARFPGLVVSGGVGTYGFTLSAAGLASASAGATSFVPGAVDAARSIVTLSATTVASGQSVTATIVPTDAAGNRIGAGRSVAASFGGGTSTTAAAAVVDQRDGSYTATFVGVRAGTAGAVTVAVDGATLRTAPSLTVVAGPAAALALAPATTTLVTLGATATLTASGATDAAGNAVSLAGVAWQSSAPTVATVAGVAGTATVTALAAGTTTVTARLGGATATATVVVQPQLAGNQSTVALSAPSVASGGAVVVTVAPKDASGAPLPTGRTVALAVTSGGGTGTLGAVTAQPDGTYSATLTGVLAGPLTVAATVDGTALASTATLTVTPGAVASLTPTPNVLSLATVGQTVTVAVVARDAAGNAIAAPTLAWSSTAAGVASVTSAGVVTAAGAGSATIAIASGAVTAGVPVTVAVQAPTLDAALTTVAVSAATVASGSAVTVTVTPKDGTGATMPAGRVVALAVASAGGTATLSAVTAQPNGSYTATLTGIVAGALAVHATVDGTAIASAPTLTVTPGAVATLAPTPATLAFTATGQSAAVGVVARDAASNVVPAPTLAWSAAAPSVATVTAGGVVTAAGAGATTVTITSGAASVGVPVAVTVPAVVADAAQSTVTLSAATVASGGTVTVTVTPKDAAGAALGAGRAVTVGLTATTGSGTLSSVTDAGNGTYTATLTGVLAGTVVVHATADGVSLAAAPSLAITAGAVASLTPTPNAVSLTAAGQTSAIAIVARDAAGNVVAAPSLAWSSTATGVATVTNAGVVTAVANGTASIGIASGTVTASVPVTVSLPVDASLTTVALSASTVASGAGVTVTVTPKDGTGATMPSGRTVSLSVVSAGGTGALSSVTAQPNGAYTATLTGVTAGTLDVHATVDGTAIASAPTLAVTPGAVATLGATPTSLSLTAAGQTGAITIVARDAAGNVVAAPPLAWQSSATSVATVAGGTVTAVASGSASVTATSGTATVSVPVTVAIPLVATQSIASRTLTVGSAATAFAPVTASGGTTPYAFALSGGTLPAGLAFSTSAGTIAGTPATSVAATTFTVTVTDAASGSAQATFSLRVDGPPSAPTIGAATAGAGQLSVAFTAPTSDGNAAITNYEYSTDGGTTWTARSPASTASPVAITGLTNGTTYSVALRAVNANGTGAASATVSGTPLTTPGAPAIGAITASSTQLSVAFTAPASTGGAAITNYEYSTDGGTTWTARSPAATTSPVVIAGLTDGVTYAVTLRAVNAAGSGAASATASGTPVALANAPTNLAAVGGSGSASLTWSAPSSSGGSPITDYVIEYSANGGTSWSTVAHAASTTAAITVTGLTNGTTYTFRVAAVTALGTGPASATATAVPGSPGAPTSVAVAFNQQSFTSQNATVTWSAPSSSGASAITDYVVEYRTSSAATWTTYAHAASTATSATITGFASATSYDFRVSARNGAGVGAPSAVLTATTTGPSSRLACTTPGTSNSSANSITVAPCAGAQSGNVILIPVTIENSSTTTAIAISPDANTTGFTALGTELNGSSQTTIFYKVAAAGDVGRSTNYGFTWTGNVKNAITLVTYNGVSSGVAPGYFSTHGTSATATSPTATVSGSSSYTLAYIFTMAGVSLSSTAPSIGEWTVSPGIWKNTTAGANNNQAAAVVTGDVDKFAPATTAAQTATTGSMTSSTKWNAAVIVIR